MLKTQDAVYIASLKKSIIETSSNPETWRYIHNQLYILDILTYIRGFGYPTMCGIGSYIADTAIVTWDAWDLSMADIKQELIRNNIDTSTLWATSVIKAKGISTDKLVKCFALEIKKISPKNIILFSGISGINMELLVTALGDISSSIKIYNVQEETLDDAITHALSCCKMI